MAVLQDYYKVIGVSSNATEEEIKTAYRKLAKQYHPDTHPGKSECEKRFREINEAYGTLGNAGKRKQYDAQRKQAEDNSHRECRTGYGEAKYSSDTDFSSFQRGFESFFGFRPEDQGSTKEKKPENTNPIDTTDLFERFMGIKR